MIRSNILTVALAFAAIATGACLRAQSDEGVEGMHVRAVPHSMDPSAATPFAVNSRTAKAALHIEVRTASQMTQQDRDVAAGAESAIQERAGFESLGFNQGDWSYQQLVCPTFPNHLLLRFSRNNGAGDVSMFSASIPKSGEGRVRIIPILRRGYSLFSPAPINALTISAFNHMGAEEHADGPKGWLMTGLCYAALAGANPQTESRSKDSDEQTFPATLAPALEIPKNGNAIIRFVTLDSRPMTWTMTFDRKGKLMKASHSASSMVNGRAIGTNVTPLEIRPVPQTAMEPNGNSVP